MNLRQLHILLVDHRAGPSKRCRFGRVLFFQGPQSLKYRSFRATDTGPSSKVPALDLGQACVQLVCQLSKKQQTTRSETTSLCVRVNKLLTDEHSEDLGRKEPKSLFKTASHALSQLSYGPMREAAGRK